MVSLHVSSHGLDENRHLDSLGHVLAPHVLGVLPLLDVLYEEVNLANRQSLT